MASSSLFTHNDPPPRRGSASTSSPLNSSDLLDQLAELGENPPPDIVEKIEQMGGLPSILDRIKRAGSFPDWPTARPTKSSPVPDTTSPVYPGRLIRPLPKRRLRDRLSAEAAEAFQLPAPSNTPLFTFPYVQPEKNAPVAEKNRPGADREDDHTCENCRKDHSDLSSDGEDDGHTHGGEAHYEYAGYDGAKMAKPPAPESNASSADGYESFENNNNKKKRKIPQSNGLSSHGHHSTLSSDMAGMGLSSRENDLTSQPDENGPTVGSYYGSGSAAMPSAGSGTGISGAGRGRYGRSGRGSLDRRPLGASTNGLNATVSGRARLNAQPWASKAVQVQPSEGIISAAIANAQQQTPVPQTKGDENVSLLSQQATKPGHKTSDFTFTYSNEASSKVVWPGQQTHLPPAPSHPLNSVPGSHRGINHTQSTARNAATGNAAYAQGQQPPTQQPQQQSTGQQQGQQQQQKKKPRRPGAVYRNAARDRRRQQEFSNFHHPPSRSEIWICEFCEYEAIFGEPPAALIRQYEIKDRAEQKKLAEKRRLLEKAKMKGRKNRKGSGKKKGKGGDLRGGDTQSDPNLGPEVYDDYAGEEEYYEDEYGDEEPLGGVPPAPQPMPPQQHGHHTGGGGYVDVGTQPQKQQHIAQQAAMNPSPLQQKNVKVATLAPAARPA